MGFESADYRELPVLPAGWVAAPLGPTLSCIVDYRGKTPPKAPFGIPCLTAANVRAGRVHLDGVSYISESTYDKVTTQGLPLPGDVLLTTEAPVAEVAEFPGDRTYHITRRLVALRANEEKLWGRYLLYALQGGPTRQLLRSRIRGSTVERILKEDITRLPIALPLLPEQRAIAHILGNLDDKIELNRRMNEPLEAMARALFKSWFVDFDPVRAKAQGQTPPGIDPATAALFPSELQDSELGEIPKGWRVAPLKEWADALSGGTPSKKNVAYWGGDIPWISPKVTSAIHADRAEHYVTEAAISNGTRLAPAGATLVMVRGMGLHQEVRVSQALHDVTFNQDVKALVATGIEPTLLLFALLDAQQVLLGRVESSGHGTGRLPSDVLLSYPLVMPELSTQETLARQFGDINRRIALLRAESQTLARTRAALLPRLLAGELSVAHAEHAVEATA